MGKGKKRLLKRGFGGKLEDLRLPRPEVVGTILPSTATWKGLPAAPQPACDPAFAPLWDVFQQALAQTQSGKGRERHNQRNEQFVDQQIVRFGDWMGTNHFQVGQAVKKAIESTKLPKERARAELLGAIVYLGAAVITLDRQPAPPSPAQAACDAFNHKHPWQDGQGLPVKGSK